jgi:hypothetical protein
MNWLMPLGRREKTKSIVHHSIAIYKCYDPSWSEAGSDCRPCALVVIVVIAVLAIVVEVDGTCGLKLCRQSWSLWS